LGNVAKTNLIDYVFVTNLISKEDRKFILQDLKNKKTTKHHWYNYGANKRDSFAHFEPDVYYSNQIQQQLLLPIVQKAIDFYIKENVHPLASQMISRISRIRFNFYTKDSTMREHVDNIHSIFDGQEKGIPILSIVGHLNDNYEGGEFMMGDKLIPLKAGDILIFPSCFLYPHTVKQVKKGIRHSFVCWAY
jgi:predicted 2-oxoglutarate/Fe(II)-dependent dioxygenase YbiX